MIQHDQDSDSGYDLFLERLADECACCDVCTSPPCAGLQQGGLCDQYCDCHGEHEDRELDDDDGEDHA